MSSGVELDAAVQEFVATHPGVPISRVHGNTRLFHDLGVDGDDAVDLLTDFADRFNVDVAQFPFDEYFGPEASGPLWILVAWAAGWSTTKTPLTIGDLIRAVKVGQLLCRPP